MPQGVLAPNSTLIHKERGGTTKKIYIYYPKNAPLVRGQVQVFF